MLSVNIGPGEGKSERADKYISMAESLLSQSITLIDDEIADKAGRYIDDARYFLEDGDTDTALAAASYSYGLLNGAISQNRNGMKSLGKTVLGNIYSNQISRDQDISSPCGMEAIEPQLELRVIHQLQEEGLLTKDSEPLLTKEGRSEIRVGLAGGVFDLIHPGHMAFLEWCKDQVDVLIVVVARGPSSEDRKGRIPVQPNHDRLNVVSQLKPVDCACLGNKNNLFEPVSRIRPEVIFLGRDQDLDADFLRKELDERNLKTRIVRSEIWDSGELSKTTRIIGEIRRRLS